MPNIIRVFPHRNSYTPTDDMAYYGLPPFPELLPTHDEVHVSCTFTWDKRECEELRDNWEMGKSGFVFKDDGTPICRMCLDNILNKQEKEGNDDEG